MFYFLNVLIHQQIDFIVAHYNILILHSILVKKEEK